jgi:hypothetical protein
MKEVFHDLMKTDGVRGVALVSFEGGVLLEDFRTGESGELRKVDWRSLVAALSGLREADLIFERLRIHIRRAEIGYVIAFSDSFSQPAMVRLNCDLLLPALRRPSEPKGLKRFFRIRK